MTDARVPLQAPAIDGHSIASSSDADFGVAFRNAFDRHHGSLARYLGRLTDDAASAADIAQEAFVRLYARGTMPANLRSWLVTVAHNMLRNERRQVRGRARILASHAAELNQGRLPTPPDAVAEEGDRRERVRRALHTLPERERRLLLLRYEGFTYRELAEALAIHEASVGTLLARAKDAFRRALGDLGSCI